ncbi:MAG: TIGR02391 family protein [Anaerolineales bacterium]|nr:TIGR02391 family protein [Anaerolineales bacterium]
MAQFEPFEETILREICNLLGDTTGGLTGSEIDNLLRDSGIEPLPGNNKRDKIFQSLYHRQRLDRSGNHVVAFIYAAMNPVRYVRDHHVFEERRIGLNRILAFMGFSLAENGKLQPITPARTISEAQERARKLYRELVNRGAHPDILRFCREELLQDNYFHAVFEATKSIADKIRDKSGLTIDGGELVTQAFSGINPLLAFNTLQTETERSEQKGLVNLLLGLFGTFRNTTAHAPRIKWAINEQDALDMLTFTSLLHRRIDQCVRTRPTL